FRWFRSSWRFLAKVARSGRARDGGGIGRRRLFERGEEGGVGTHFGSIGPASVEGLDRADDVVARAAVGPVRRVERDREVAVRAVRVAGVVGGLEPDRVVRPSALAGRGLGTETDAFDDVDVEVTVMAFERADLPALHAAVLPGRQRF